MGRLGHGKLIEATVYGLDRGRFGLGIRCYDLRPRFGEITENHGSIAREALWTITAAYQQMEPLGRGGTVMAIVRWKGRQ
jgi:hypothetical protein